MAPGLTCDPNPMLHVCYAMLCYVHAEHALHRCVVLDQRVPAITGRARGGLALAARTGWHGYAMVCYGMVCYAMVCYAMLCCAMLCAYGSAESQQNFDLSGGA